MATGVKTDLCNICEGRNKTNTAIKWCPECDEKLCKDCYGNHTVSKLSRNHRVIDIDHFRKLPKSVLAVKNICDKHDMKFTHFCRLHDTICCPMCISNPGLHCKCRTLALEEVIKATKTSGLLQSVEESLKNLEDNLRRTINDRQLNLQNTYDQKDQILKEVKEMKTKIIKHLNDFEKKISNDLDLTTKKHTLIPTSEIAGLKKSLQHVEMKSDELLRMRKYGTDLQIFIGSRIMDKEIKRLKNNTRELVENTTSKQAVVTLQWNRKINEVIEIMQSLGSITEEETPTSDQVTKLQVLPSPPCLSINCINMIPKAKFRIPSKKGAGVSGCSMFSNDKIIFSSCRDKQVMVLKQTYEIEKIIPVSPGPWDVTFIGDNKVAVSTDEGVKIINIITNAIEKTINIGSCDGLDYYKGSLLCCVYRTGVVSVDLKKAMIRTLVPDRRTGRNYCAAHEDRIYATRDSDNSVTCYTMEGEKMWKFENPLVLFGPSGIAVDKDSNIFCSSSQYHSIFVLSPDGKRHRTLLTKQDGINSPAALYFDRSKNQLLVGNWDGNGLLFYMSWMLYNNDTSWTLRNFDKCEIS